MTALSRSREEIAAARLLAEGGFGSQAISRAYYAAFYAAEEALASLDESRSEDADRAIGEAERFVAAVESWLAERQTGRD